MAGPPSARPLGPLGPQSEEEEDEDDDESLIWRVVHCEACDWPDGPEGAAATRSAHADCCGVFAVVLFLTVLTLCIMSLDTVPPLHRGITYNHFQKSADTSRVYHPGRRFVGPFSKFLLFPAAVQNIEFMDQQIAVGGRRFEPLHTRTKDGLGLHLQVSLQYQLRVDVMGRLYEKFNQAYEDVYVSTVRDILIRAASEYSAQQLWKEREVFANEMQAMVNQSLWGIYAECFGLQLLLVDLPDNFEDTITRTQVQQQLMSTREMEQVKKTIEAETKVIEADFERQVKVIKAGGQANFTVVTKEAKAKAQQMKINFEAKVMGKIGFELGMLGPDLVLYQRYSALDDLEDSRVVFGFGGRASMFVGASGL